MVRCLILIFVFLPCLVEASKPCFNMEAVRKKAEEKTSEKEMLEGLRKHCEEKTPDDKEKSKACMRDVIERFIDVKKYKKHFLEHLEDETKREDLSTSIDECGKDIKKFFPCVGDVVAKMCPEIGAFYRQEMEKLGY